VCEVQTSGRAYQLGPDPEVHRRQLKHFIACVEGREQPICPPDEAVRILEAALG
jgi:hypothetical protein